MNGWERLRPVISQEFEYPNFSNRLAAGDTRLGETQRSG
jgi:hypothetical protein